jgi:Spy/CpxP family protein refolding chaperone
MSDPSNVTTATGTQPPQGRWTRRRTAILVLLVALAVGLTGVFATGAFSRGFGFGPGHHFGSMSPAMIEDRADRMVRHVAIEIDATAEQQERLRALVKAAVRDLLPMREKAQAARAQARELLTQPNINRAEIERFRTEQLALADAASRRLVQALADAAEILTPEQRNKINDHLERREHWRGWRRG